MPIIRVFLCLAIALAGGTAADAKPHGSIKPAVADLTVVVKNLRSDQGEVKLALWLGAEGFTDADTAVAKLTVVPSGGQAKVTFPDLPPGTYALASYHDENGNGKFDKTLIGLPEEGLGFSNGAWIKLGPPSFKDAAIKLGAEPKIAVISLRY